jgi:hypothetical protein
MEAEPVNALIRHRIEGADGGLRNKIVRLVVQNVSPELRAQLDYSAIRQARAEALHFELDPKRPDSAGASGEHGPHGPARPLEQEWEELAQATELPPGVDRDRLAKLGRDYLAKSASVEAT